MSTRDDADVFHAWVTSEGLYPSTATAPVPMTPERQALLPQISDAGRTVLRTKLIEHIVLNEPKQTIYVFTKRAKPSKKQLALLPQAIGQSAIEYRQGTATEIGGSPPTARGKPFYVVKSANADCYACGGSVSLGNALDAGTLGALVKNADGVLLGLSNNHVTGGCNYAAGQMPIVAPGVLDVSPLGYDPRTLGYHERSLPLVAGLPGTAPVADNLDAAVFRVRDPSLVSSMQGDSYDTPTTTKPIEAGMAVEKVGRTTGHTQGVVLGVSREPMPINYESKGVGFTFMGHVFFDPLWVVEGKSGVFSEPGDSGSLITTQVDGARHALGLLVGGMSGPQGRDYSFIVPIESILARLSVQLVGGHNT